MLSLLHKNPFPEIGMKQNSRTIFPIHRLAMIRQKKRRGVECACWSMDHQTRTKKPANHLLLRILMCISLIQVGEAWKQPPILPTPSGFHSLVTLLILQTSAYAAPSFKAELVISEINISGQDNDQVN